MAPHSSTLAWRIPWTEEPGGLQSMWLLSRTRLSDFTFTFHFHALEKEMATHSSVLAWRIPGTEEPGGLLSMGSHRVGHDWSNLAAAVNILSQCCFCLRWGVGRNSWSKINHSPCYFYILASVFIYLKQCSYSLNYLINFLNFAFYILYIDHRKGTLTVMYLYVAQC